MQNTTQMNILYYSNYCKHSQNVVKQLVKCGMSDKISFICIDNRKRDSVSNQTYIFLENGSKTLLPPNIHSVPSLLLVNEKFRLITGDSIIEYYQPHIENKQNNANPIHGEPAAFDLGSVGFIQSDKYTFYNALPEEIGVSGRGTNRQMHNYVKATHEPLYIETPPDNYRPDKVSGDVTLDDLQQKRNEEINRTPTPLSYSTVIQPPIHKIHSNKENIFISSI